MINQYEEKGKQSSWYPRNKNLREMRPLWDFFVLADPCKYKSNQKQCIYKLLKNYDLIYITGIICYTDRIT